MRALHWVVAVLLFAPACHLSHSVDDGGSDAGTSVADAVSVDVPPDTRLGTDAPPDPEGTRCGPNVCRGAEICCDERCGVCAFAGECPSFECPGG